MYWFGLQSSCCRMQIGSSGLVACKRNVFLVVCPWCHWCKDGWRMGALIEWKQSLKNLCDTEVLPMLWKVKLASALLKWSVKSHTEVCYSTAPHSTQHFPHYPFHSFCHTFCSLLFLSLFWLFLCNGGKVSLASQVFEYGGPLSCKEILIFSMSWGLKPLVAG